MGVGRILLEYLKELLFIYTAAQDDCEMCVGVYFMTNTPGYMRNVFLVVLNWWDATQKLVLGLFCSGL